MKGEVVMKIMDDIKKYFKTKKNKKLDKKCNDAYNLMKTAEKYATSDQFMIRLQTSSLQTYEGFFNRLKDEGYDFTYDVIEGELFSPCIVYVRIKKLKFGKENM